MDQYFWLPGWQEIDPLEFMDLQYEMIMRDRWIIDGNCMRTISIRLFEADTVIYLDISRWRCILHAIKRQWQNYGKVRADMPKGCQAYFDKHFFLFLKYIWQYKKRFHRYIFGYFEIVEEMGSAQIYHVRSYRELDNLLKIINKGNRSDS